MFLKIPPSSYDASKRRPINGSESFGNNQLYVSHYTNGQLINHPTLY